MRILIYLLLGGVVLGIMAYGLHLIWRSVFPSEEKHDVPAGEKAPLLSPLGTRSGWLFFVGMVLLLLWVVLDRASVGQEIPDDFVPPPAVNERGDVSNRYY